MKPGAPLCWARIGPNTSAGARHFFFNVPCHPAQKLHSSLWLDGVLPWQNVALAQYLGMRLLRTTERYRICGWRILRWHLEVISESKRKPRTASTGFFLPLFILTIVCKNHTEWWKFPCGFLAEIFCPKSNPDIFFFPELLLQFLLEIIATSLSALKFCTVLLNTDKQLLHFSLCVGDLIRIYSLCIHTAGCKVICIHTTATTDPAEYYPFFLTFIAAFKTPTFF